ncbi:MAG: fructose-6-phosphate aldolase [Alphaproteobacteria bacterium]|nr:fructose-6-phosphate aldolase [Alphaproteobacteria bacterium]
MEIFLDTAEIESIEKYSYFIDGVTTNPSLMALNKEKEPYKVIRRICEIVQGPVSAEVLSDQHDEMLNEGLALSKIGSNVCVKLPCTLDGLKVCKELSNQGIATNVTLCFSAAQALMAAQCGATYVSPFIGRLEDIGQDGIVLIEEIADIFAMQKIETKILAASIRNINHFTQALQVGADAVTLPTKVLEQCFVHPLTTSGLIKFKEDWRNRAKN